MEKDSKKTEEPEQSGQPDVPESIYENFNKVPIKVLDAVIWLCIAALVAVIAVGVLNR